VLFITEIKSKPSKQNQIPFIIQNYLCRPISGHFQVHNLCLKRTEEGIYVYIILKGNKYEEYKYTYIPSLIYPEHKLWTWGWPKIGRNMYFCKINGI
jgi:hypothetical protein